MKITELKKIAKENDYELKSEFLRLRFEREVECGVNKININKCFDNRVWVSNPKYCDDKDFYMIKAAMEYAESSNSICSVSLDDFIKMVMREVEE